MPKENSTAAIFQRINYGLVRVCGRYRVRNIKINAATGQLHKHRQFGNIIGIVINDAVSNREQIFVINRVQETDTGTRQRCFTHTMGQQRHFIAQIGTYHQQTLKLINICQLNAQRRHGWFCSLAAEIPAAQTMINISGIKMPEQARRQIAFFNGSGW